MQDITMPRLSDSMEEGKVLRWLKRPGDTIAVGEVLLEVETDKADMEIEATDAGVLREIRLAEGETGAVGAVIAVLDDPGTAEVSPLPSGSAPAPVAGPEHRSPGAGDAAPAGPPEEEVRAPESVSLPPQTPAPVQPSIPAPLSGETGEGRGAGIRNVRVSPLARTRAAELGIDPEGIKGSGPGGRVTRGDVEEASRRTGASPRVGSSTSGQESEEAATTTTPVETSSPSASEGTPVVRPPGRDPAPPPVLPQTQSAVRRIPLSGMRASIARRMAESKREAPHFYVRSTADMEFAVRLRAALRERGDAVTYNHIVLKACADALAAVPELNARFAGEAIELFPDVNLGVVTALPDGVIVPVIHGADRLGLLELASRARALAEKARERNFSAEDLSGATFSVSNLGMYEVEDFVAVINPPQAAILAVGSVAQRPVVRSGAVAVAHTLHLTLSCDHRAIDGAKAAEFLQEVRERLQNPLRLLMPRE